MNIPSAPARDDRGTTSHRLSGKLLLVRHGPGRGPRIRFRGLRPRYLDPLLDDFTRRDPDLKKRIAIWETGTPPSNLTEVRAILFALQDPLKERFGACYADAVRLADEARGREIRLINPPETLSNSIKSKQARLWLEAGLPVPRHYSFDSRESWEQALRVAPFPAILRADLLHSQREMTFCATADDARRAAEDHLPLPGALVEFIDTRKGFQLASPESEWARFYHKKRAFVFGDRVRTNHVFFGPDPIVGSLSCTFDHYRSLNPWRRWRATRACRPHIELDLAYFQQETEHETTLRAAAHALGFQFAAIDYSSTADGGLVLWEANPHFCLHLWPLQILYGPRKLAPRMGAFHEAIGQFFRGLLTEPPG